MKLPVAPRMTTTVSLLLLASQAYGHGAVTQPPSRNAIDGRVNTAVHPWNASVPESVPFMFWCASPDGESQDPRKVSGISGQACFWFNNGCDISCEECDGTSGQLVHPKFILNGTGSPEPWGGNGIVWNGKDAVKKGVRSDDKNSTRLSICKTPKHNATVCDPELRTMNIDAPCGSKADVTYYAPWRYPGAAPVIDSCGTAGGVYQWQPAAAAGGDYAPTVNAKRGDLGSMLPKAPSGTVWTAGSEVEVAWTHKAWHGGGYQCVDCPLSAACSHFCPFAGIASVLPIQI
jgi:hypothetical protein